MTGITKDELEQMARDAGCTAFEAMFFASSEKGKAVVNAILERAAVECEDTDIEEARGGSTYYAQLGDAGATRSSIAHAIRALKINTGD